jgi:hypothetical protein
VLGGITCDGLQRLPFDLRTSRYDDIPATFVNLQNDAPNLLANVSVYLHRAIYINLGPGQKGRYSDVQNQPAFNLSHCCAYDFITFAM